MSDNALMVPKKDRPMAAVFRESLYNRDVQPLHIWPGMTVNQWLDKTGWRERITQDPIVIIVNGEELLEADYDRILTQGDMLELQMLPRGGIGIGTIIQWVYYAVVIVSAVHALTMPEPEIPESADVKEGSPTYTLSARGNRYRPERKGPVLYGKLRVVPDFDQLPFSTYDTNDDQTLHMLFRITQGTATVDVSSIRFEDTPLSSFSGVQTEVVLPGAVPTLFPVGVVTSDDVSNIELTDDYTTAYVANEVGTEISRIAVDMSSPAIYQQDREEGHLLTYRVQFAVEYQAIDDNNDPIGTWTEAGRPTFVSGSQDPLRRTFGYTVTPGRYQVRMRRITAKNPSQYVQDTVTWATLKGYLHDPDDTSHCTRLAISVRASEQIGNRALTKMSVIATRQLPAWDSEFGWQSESETRSIAWALADLCRASYAGSRSDLHYDLVKLAELDAQLTPAGHHFDAYYDTEGVTVWDALVKAGTPGRITPIDKSGFYTFVRDEAQSTTVQTFTMRNIRHGSFRIQHAGVLEETADAVIVKFQDEGNDYRTREILCALPDSPAQNPREINLFGVTNAARAKELGMFYAASTRYRRKQTPFDAGIEGRIPFYGSKIAISHFLLGAEGVPQVSGDIVARDGSKLRLSERVTGQGFSDPHIIMHDLDGEPMPAYPVTLLSDFVVEVSGSPDWTQIKFEPGYKSPMFILGDGAEYVTESKVTRIQRNGSDVSIECFVDDPRVYLYGDNVDPPDSVTIPAPQDAAPRLSELEAHVGGSVDAPVVTLSWSLENADRTDIEVSDDGGQTWEALGNGFTLDNQYVDRPAPGDYVYRLAAVNLFRGPWVSVQVSTQEAEYSAPLPPENLALREAFTGPVLKLQWDSGSHRHLVQAVVGGVVQYSETVNGTRWDFAATTAQEWGVGRSFDVRVYAVGENGKTSETYASISVSNPAPAQLNNLTVTPLKNVVVINFDWPPDNDLAGISVWASGSTGFTPGDGNLEVDRSVDPVLSVSIDINETKYIKVAAVDVWGDDNINYSGEFTATAGPITETEISDDSISTPKLQANSVTAEKAFVEYLSALAADLGLVTAGTIQTTSGTGARAELSSSGDFPFWIGEGSLKNAGNGHVYYDKVSKTFVIRDPTSGARLEIQPGGSLPIWLGAGAKTVGNAYLYWDNGNSELVVNGNVTARDIEAGAVNIIDTLMLQDQAVTIPNSAYTATATTVPLGSWKTVQSVSYTSTGAPVSIHAFASKQNFNALSGDRYHLRVRRNGVTLIEVDDGFVESMFQISLGDDPPAGAITYDFDLYGATVGSGSDLNVQHRSLLALETKK